MLNFNFHAAAAIKELELQSFEDTSRTITEQDLHVAAKSIVDTYVNINPPDLSDTGKLRYE